MRRLLNYRGMICDASCILYQNEHNVSICCNILIPGVKSCKSFKTTFSVVMWYIAFEVATPYLGLKRIAGSADKPEDSNPSNTCYCATH
jgi:hypothetical protein